MGKFLAVVTPYLLIANGFQIFRDLVEIEKECAGPFFIFLTALFLLLYDLRLYPKSLRKQDNLSQTAIEFMVAAFLMEHILLDFWIPLENETRTVVSRFAENVEESTRDVVVIENIVDLLMDGVLVSYLLSIFFLLSVLHAIRAIDFRAFEEGPSCFFVDISYRLKRFLKKKLKALGFRRQKRVRIQESVEVTKKQKNNRKNEIKLPDDLCFEKLNDFYAAEDFDDKESMDEPSLLINDFDIPGENDLMCDQM